MMKKLCLCIVVFKLIFTTTPLTAAESLVKPQWQDITQKLLDQVKNKAFVATDIKNINNKLCIVGTLGSLPQQSIIFLQFDNTIKKSEDLIPNITGTSNISLASTDETPLVQALKENGAFEVYNIKKSLIWGNYLERILKNIYFIEKTNALIGAYPQSEFWTCTEDGCYIFGNTLNNKQLINNAVPNIVGLEPESISDTHVYWTVVNSIIERFAFKKTEAKPLGAFVYNDANIKNAFQHYKFKQLIPYALDSAIGLGIFTRPDIGSTPQVIRITLDMRNKKTYSIKEMNTPPETHAIAVTKQGSEFVLYALTKSKDNNFSIQSSPLNFARTAAIQKVMLEKKKPELSKNAKNIPASTSPKTSSSGNQEPKLKILTGEQKPTKSTSAPGGKTGKQDKNAAPVTTDASPPGLSTTQQTQKKEPEEPYFASGTDRDYLEAGLKRWRAQIEAARPFITIKDTPEEKYLSSTIPKPSAPISNDEKKHSTIPQKIFAVLSNSWNRIKSYFSNLWGMFKAYGG